MAESDQISLINKYEDQQQPERFDQFQIEKQRFNTGPCASRHYHRNLYEGFFLNIFLIGRLLI